MIKRKHSRKICLGLATVTLFSQLLGCTKTTQTSAIEPMEAEESPAISYDIIGGKDVMPVGTQWGPYVTSALCEDGQMVPYMITDEMWSDLSEMGINVLFQNADKYNTNENIIFDSMDLCEKYNMAYYVRDDEIIDMVMDGTATLENVTTRLSEYMNHPAFGGLHLVDEAKTPYYFADRGDDRKFLSNYAQIGPMINQELGIPAYHQVFPTLNDPNDRERYKQYVAEFCETMQPQYLAMNKYPLVKAYRDHLDMFFFDVAVIWQNAKENNIPWWAYFGAGSQWNDRMERFNTEGYYPEEGAYDWHINVCLAFGMQGIVIFPGVQPYYFAYSNEPSMDFERNGCIGVFGNKNRWYYYTQDIINHVQVIDEVLMNSVNKGVILSGDKVNDDCKYAKDFDCIIDGTSWRELKNVSGDAMVGCFNYQGKTAFYVANYDQEYAQDIQLSFDDTHKLTVIQDAETSYISGHALTLKMRAGDGALIIVE